MIESLLNEPYFSEKILINWNLSKKSYLGFDQEKVFGKIAFLSKSKDPDFSSITWNSLVISNNEDLENFLQANKALFEKSLLNKLAYNVQILGFNLTTSHLISELGLEKYQQNRDLTHLTRMFYLVETGVLFHKAAKICF